MRKGEGMSIANYNSKKEKKRQQEKHSKIDSQWELWSHNAGQVRCEQHNETYLRDPLSRTPAEEPICGDNPIATAGATPLNCPILSSMQTHESAEV